MNDVRANTDLAALSFEEILERLDQVVTRLEQGDAPLELALSIFEQGVALSREGNQRLDDAERRIEELMGDGTTTSFSPAEEGEGASRNDPRLSNKEPCRDE